MLFPFEQPEIDLSFTCEHCGRTYYNENNTVQMCPCPKAEQSRVIDRERMVTFNRAKEAEKPTFREICESRKLRSGKRCLG